MAQKDKVKELVGRSLDSYHTKALQQMDRIEKKNKEQNYKISILTNELDNDYLTKTEEGSVISLEHSKEGMIYLDELQGNTLVNYCTDGAKELTLNGDIDVEGTSVTLTEGVDNGLVDVMCEGNTLVNTIGKFSKLAGSAIVTDEYIQLSRGTGDSVRSNGIVWKPSTVYTIVYTILETNFTNSNGLTLSSSSNIINTHYIHGATVGTHKATFTTKDDSSITTNGLVILISSSQSNDKYIKLKDIYVLEGDWRNKEVPSSYFEGMKSVGQDDENGHKIEITSQTGNLYNEDEHLYKYSMSIGDLLWGFSSQGNRRSIKVPCKPNTTYTLSKTGGDRMIICSHNEDFDAKKQVNMKHCYYNSSNSGHIESYTFTTHSDSKVICAYVSVDNLATNIHLEELPNKKEISLNEPLRSLPNGVKDKIVKIGSKYYVERNCKAKTLNGTETGWYIWNVSSTLTNTIAFAMPTNGENGVNEANNSSTVLVNTICDKFIESDEIIDFEWHMTHSNVVANNRWWAICINRTKLSTQDVIGFTQWLSQNPTTIVYQLETPIYEELPIDPTVSTYNDITHISNNSTIPCNMVVKNSGYNAIIKPSTLYTVALDTDKSGTVGINLGGAKVTTTNNVATITTPATLADDSLRLHGKGIKASKVRLLEGDKTNWIPSHFEGMKSSFEDKLQEDGTFKMEISSCINNYIKTLGERHNIKTIYLYSTNSIQPYLKYFNLVDNYNKCNNLFDYYYVSNNSSIWINLGTFNRTNALCVLNQKISECEGKSNKIQFSSIEPLRGNKFTKDKFIFKDGKLMIERNFNKLLLDGNIRYPQWHQTDMYISIYPNSNDKSTCYRVCNIPNKALKWQSSISNVFTTCETNEAFGINAREGYLSDHPDLPNIYFCMGNSKTLTMDDFYRLISENPIEIVYQLKEPTYEEIPFELQKIILEGYENGTLFFDTNIPPTVTTTYAGETPIVKSIKSSKIEVMNNTNDINDNIVPYLMDMDYRVVCLQLEGGIENVSMARLFGGTYEMLQRDILSNRYSKEEYKYRLDAYLSANKITEDEYNKLGDMLND